MSELASWIEIDKPALQNNLNYLRSLFTSETSLGVVLKANAYGHGLLEILQLIHSKVDIIHVISPKDAFLIREWESSQKSNQKRVLVIGAINTTEAVKCAALNIEVVIGTPQANQWPNSLRDNKLNLKAHIHIDTGLGREGFLPSEIETQLAFLKNCANEINVVAIMTHFANTEDVTEQTYALKQLQKLQDARNELSKIGINSKLETHCAASAATIVLSNSHFDSVRVGIAMYGLWPSQETRLSCTIVNKTQLPIKPVLSWKCKSQAVRMLNQGSFVGYGCTFRCERETRIAVFPVGYFDGYPRIASGKAYFLINGTRAPIIGRIMMNHIVVDVTNATRDDSPVTACLIGTDGSETISTEMLGAWAETINYEVVARIGQHLKRIIIEL